MNNTLKRHRCFQVPRKKLDVFLVALDVNFSDKFIEHRMSHVFPSTDARYYEVVVGQYGSYPFVENQLEKFVESL